MSYGIWRHRGKGWSYIEIDTTGNTGILVLFDGDRRRTWEEIAERHKSGEQDNKMDSFHAAEETR